MKKKVTKKKAVKKLKNRIAIILDRSGSMGSIRCEAIDAFNQQVKAIKENSKKMDTKVSLVTFSTLADEPTVWNKPASSLKQLTEKEYAPDGMTAMYDAVGSTIDKFEQMKEASEEDCSFLVVIISDGQENNSKKYSSQDIAERIQKLQKTNRWTFTYLGANQDLGQVSKTLGIALGNTMAFQASSQGMVYASSVNIGATANYLRSRSVGETSSTSFYSGSPAADATDDKATTAQTVTKIGTR